MGTSYGRPVRRPADLRRRMMFWSARPVRPRSTANRATGFTSARRTQVGRRYGDVRVVQLTALLLGGRPPTLAEMCVLRKYADHATSAASPPGNSDGA